MSIRESQTTRREGIDVGRLDPATFAAIGFDVANPKIVREDEYDVGPLRRGQGADDPGKPGNQELHQSCRSGFSVPGTARARGAWDAVLHFAPNQRLALARIVIISGCLKTGYCSCPGRK